MEISDFPFESIKAFSFKSRPESLPANLRPLYRIALILVVLKLNCRANSSSLLRLQFFNWILKSPPIQKIFSNLQSNQHTFVLELLHMDPMVNLALRYARAEKLVSITKVGHYKLTQKGIHFVETILGSKERILTQEIDLLNKIGKQITEIRLKDKLI